MLLLHTKETVVAAAAVLLSGWLCGVITGAPTTRCFLYFIFPYVGTPGGETRPHPCRLSLLWGDKKGSWEKGWTWTREQAHHDGTLWGIFSYLHSDILTQQHWQFQKSLSSYCDDVSTESCFVKIKLYFVFVFLIIFFFTGRSVVLCFLLSSLLDERASERKHERGKVAPSLPSHSEVKRLSVMKCDSWRISWLFSHCGKSLIIATSRVIKKNKTHVWHNRFSQYCGLNDHKQKQNYDDI